MNFPTCPLPIETSSNRPKLLIVDDQAANIHLLHQIFKLDHDVFVATGGMEAIALYLRAAPDLILLDVVMPLMDGYAVCRELKSKPLTAGIPVIFLTGHSSATEEEMGLDVGAADFISKSASEKIIRARVNTHITLKRQADLLRSLTLMDSLTGLANRRHFDEAFGIAWDACARAGKPLIVDPRFETVSWC